MKLNKALSFTEKKIIAELLLNWGIKSCVPIQAWLQVFNKATKESIKGR